MKVVMFCGGLGTRIRDYSENVPKPMVPVGNQPILWHLIQYYRHFGHHDFILCLGFKGNAIKEFFLNYRPSMHRDCVVSDFGRHVDVLGEQEEDWRVSLVDTGMWRNIGERLLAVRKAVEDEEIFLANYSDGLCDLPLDEMTRWFERSGKVAAFVAVQPNFSYHLLNVDPDGVVLSITTSHQSEIWINGGYFIFRRAIFDYIQPGEELVVEPFNRLIEAGQLLAYKHRGFWASMDTLKDKMILEEMFEKGHTPWLPWTREGNPQ
jgi:glucose-1-phosphate cytidylyltransferase